jgi:hypothetical protein
MSVADLTLLTPEHCTTPQMLDALRRRYERDDGSCVFIPELRVGTGYGKGKEQRIDAYLLHCWGSLDRIAFEIKASRGDFLRELKQPLKRRAALVLSNEFYFVAPEGVIKQDELPLECGLIVVKWSSWETIAWHVDGYQHEPHEGWIAETKTAAVHRDTSPPTWSFLAAVARRLAKADQ